MDITAEYLTELKQKAEQERARLLSQAHQATGAIGILEVMLQRLNEPKPETKIGS
ncbi:MAG TPA: hypothetical protein VF982_00250 [Anaerolineales bacterium]